MDIGNIPSYYGNHQAIQPSTQVKTRKYACPNPNCTSVFKERRHLGTHVKYHCGKPPRYKCAYCNYKSTWSGSIKSHTKNVHRDKEPRVVELYQPLQKVINYICPNDNCKKTFKWKSSWRNHIKNKCKINI